MSDLREPALALARSGRAVFPCNPDKSPRTPRGFHDASTDPETITAWDWNSGGLIGAVIREGEIVVDVDPRNGGDETLDLLAETGRKLPKTRTVETRSGGRHFYLTIPEGSTLRGSLGPGVDVKRHGKGYVIVPPSSGYRLVRRQPPVPAPDWLLEELVVPDRPESTSEASPPKFFPFEAGTPYGLRARDGEIARLATAQDGSRNDALNRAAFALAQLAAGGELSEQHAMDDLLAVAERIGLEEGEARKTIESGWKAGEREPRQAPEIRGDATEVGRTTGAAPEWLPAVSADESRFWVDWAIDEPPPPFYCSPLLPKNAYVLVYGPTEAAKSMAWLGLLAEGSHSGVRSSVYSLENPPHTDRDRLRRWSPDPANFRLTNEPLDMNDARQVEALVAREEAFGTDVVLIDTYSHAFNSRSDDGNAKAIEFARRVRYLMSKVGCSVVVVDHTGFEGDEPRDASAKRQQVDVAILMQKRGEWVAGQPSKFSMRNRKAARFANPFYLQGEIADVRDERRGLKLRWSGETPKWEDA